MTTVSKPNSNPPSAPVSVAFIRLKLGRIVECSSKSGIILHTGEQTVNPGHLHRSVNAISLNPFAFAHQRLSDIRRRDAVNIQPFRSNHPVHMDQAVIRAFRSKFFRGELVAIAQAR